MEFYRRNRRRVWRAAAIGAAGAAAYYAYRWYYTEDDQQSSDRRQHGSGRDRRQADQESLQQHFASIQHISEQKTLPTLLPSLQAALLRTIDTAPLKDKLRRMRGASDGEAAGSAKVEAWTELAQASFALAAASAWALPLLDLLLRVQINVLGRHLYIASLLADEMRAVYGAEQALQPLSTDQQHAFLGYADTLARRGIPQLAAAMRAAVHSVLQGLELGHAVTAEGAMSLLSDIHAEFEAAATNSGWPPFLLPADDGDADPQVAEMLAEVRHVVSTPLFDRALKAAVQQAAAAVAHTLAASIGTGDGLPLAKVVPLTEAAAAPLLRSDNVVVRATGQLPVVAELCAFAYAAQVPPSAAAEQSAAAEES